MSGLGRLLVYRGEELLSEHDLLRAQIGLGRHPENDIVLDDRTLSRYHARIERRDSGYVVVDLGAQNGVTLNGARIETEMELQPGDRIDLGRYTAVFDQEESPPPARSSAIDDLDLDMDLESPDVDATAGAAQVPDFSRDEGDEDLDGDLLNALGDALDGELDDDPPESPPTSRNAPGRGDPIEFAARTNFTQQPDESAPSAEYAPPKPTLVLLNQGAQVSRHVVEEQGLTVGRSKNCDIVISLLGLSRQHCRITPGDEGVVVEDLGSQNGTWVNNERIEGPTVLRHGDLLNFYDFGVLFLEDGDVEVGFPVAETVAPEPASSMVESRPPPARIVDPPVRPSTPSSPAASQARSDAAEASARTVARADEETALGLQRPRPGSEDIASHLDALGEGSFLGDEFEEGASKERRENELLEEGLFDDDDDDAFKPAEPPSARVGGRPQTTELIDGGDLSAGLDEEDLEADLAFSGAMDDFGDVAGTNGEIGQLADRTTAGLDVASLRMAQGGTWVGDDELHKMLARAHDTALVTLEVTLNGRAYTQTPLTQTATRVGVDPRCEFALPRSSGLLAWHLTLVQLGGALLAVRSCKLAEVEMKGAVVDTAMIRNGDVLDLGKVQIKFRIR